MCRSSPVVVVPGDKAAFFGTTSHPTVGEATEKEKGVLCDEISRMQYVLGVTTVWVALPAALNVVRCAQHGRAADWLFVLLHICTTCCSVCYWRSYDQRSVVGVMDSTFTQVTLLGLVAKGSTDVLLETIFIIGTIGLFYASSVLFRIHDWPKCGITSHLSFRYAAFWLSMLVLAGGACGGSGCADRLECLFGDSAKTKFCQFTVVYGLHTATELVTFEPRHDLWRGHAATLPLGRYVAGILRTSAVAALAGLSLQPQLFYSA